MFPVYKALAVKILYSLWVTVRAVTLIFISGRGSTISSAQEGKSEFIYLVKSLKINCLSRTNHVNPDRIYTELTFITP